MFRAGEVRVALRLLGLGFLLGQATFPSVDEASVEGFWTVGNLKLLAAILTTNLHGFTPAPFRDGLMHLGHCMTLRAAIAAEKSIE